MTILFQYLNMVAMTLFQCLYQTLLFQYLRKVIGTFLINLITGFICDVTGGYDGVFYAASISSILCSFVSFLLIMVDITYKKDRKNLHINTISIVSHL